jgi:hypothetical protein
MYRKYLPIVLLLAALPLAAQMDRAVLTGTIMDPSKSVVPNAKIVAHAIATGIDYTATSNSAGVYTLTGLPVGQYKASVAATGFETLEIEAFGLEVGETRTLNPTLRVGAVGSTVSVEAATPDLNLANAEVGGVISNAQTEELPVNGRYWASLEALIPGAISAGTGTQDQIRFSGLCRRITTLSSMAWTPPASITPL